MVGCLRTRVHKQSIIALYFESETELKFYNLEAWLQKFYFKLKFQDCNLDLIVITRDGDGADRNFKPIFTIRVSKGAKIRNRYNQVPHLTQDTNGTVTNSQLNTTNDRKPRGKPFPSR